MPHQSILSQCRLTVCRVLSGLAFLCCMFNRLNAQVEDPGSGEILENFFRDADQGSESDAQFLTEYLEMLRAKPLNLNNAKPEELLQTGMLNALQIEQLRAYRETLGPLLNIYELQAVPGWELSDIERIRPYVNVTTGLDQRVQPLGRGLWKGDNELLMRWGRPSQIINAGSVEGRPNVMAMRYRHAFDNRLRYGFTAENDAGEAFFSGSNRRGFDFYSAHFFLQNAHPVFSTVALGDYSARFGQGLLLQTGFTPGKSAESVSVARGGQRLRPYAAFGEVFFLRGAAATVQLGDQWEATLLYSRRRRDGNVLLPADTADLDDPEIAFSSLQSSGLHRTPAEIADEKAVQEQAAGIALSRRFRRGQVSLNGAGYHFDKPWTPDLTPYRQFVFTGKTLTGISIDYDFHYRNVLAFGEAARSDNGGLAGINGLLVSADRRTTLAVVHRYFARDYQSIYAAPFSETSTAANEHGLYIGMETKPSKPWRINAYADMWRHPWLRFGVDAPSSGWEYLARVIWTPRRGVSMYVLWFSETKERSDELEFVSDLYRHRRERLRLHASCKVSSALELRSRVEWTNYAIGDRPASRGFVAYQEAVFKALSFPVSGTFRFTLFDTEDFNTRVFTFENDLFAALSVPAFSGRGSRMFLNLAWRVNDRLRMEGRFEQTLQEKTVAGSGILGPRQAFKLQARLKF